MVIDLSQPVKPTIPEGVNRKQREKPLSLENSSVT